MTTDMPSSKRIALAISSLVFGLAASMTYLAERLYERLRHGKSDPRLIIGEQHAMFYWRAFIAVWWGSVIALVLFRLLRVGSGDVSVRSTRLTWAALLLAPVALLWAYRLP